MTPSNTDLQEALERILIDGFADQDLSNNEKASAMTNTLLKLFQAREQQLLTELLGELPEKQEWQGGPTDEKYFNEGLNRAIDQVVSVIERLQNKTNDGGSDGASE